MDLQIDDPKLSRVHASVSRAGLVFEIRDLGSRNGTFINGERVERHSLTVGDVVRVGDTLLEIGPEGAGKAIEPGDTSLVARSSALLAAVEAADRVAPSDLPVLLLGETGTGKEVFARRVHARSGRRGAFLAINCASLPRELVESTLFGHRKGAFTGATADSDGSLRPGPRRDAVPGRGRRAPRAPAGQAPAGSGEPRVLAGGQCPGGPEQRAHHRGEQCRPRCRDRFGRVPCGSLCPARRNRHPAAASAVAAPGHPRAGGVVSVRARAR